MKNILLKSITLILFVSLIGFFVAYKSGYIGRKGAAIFLSPNGSVISEVSRDSTTVNDSIPKRPLFIPSSKVLIISEDEVPKITPEQRVLDSVRIRIMSSSKSGIIFEPVLETDTTQIDE